MSINHFLNKIKGLLGVDSFHVVFFLVIIGVSLSSFALGRISIELEKKSENLENKNFIIKNEKEEGIEENSFSTKITEEKRYVASKNGKLYYSPTCSGVKRIKPENEVWFSSKDEAEKSGYSFATSCK